jgi:hypothetical protein
MSQMFDVLRSTQALREKALEFADEAAHEADYCRRRELEDAAMAYWRAARRGTAAVSALPSFKTGHSS